MTVQIFRKNNSYNFLGTGFLIKDRPGFLLTVAHLFLEDSIINLENLFFKIESDSKFHLIEMNPICLEYKPITEYNSKIDEDYFDLAILKTEVLKNEISNLNLYPEKDYIEKSIKLNGYFVNENSEIEGREIECKKKDYPKTWAHFENNAKSWPLKNCIELFGESKPGNSGGIIRFENKVIGIIVSGIYNAKNESNSIRALQSSYIIRKLNDIGLTNQAIKDTIL